MAEWIFPSNPNIYRTDDALHDSPYIEWTQTKNAKNLRKDDIVYIYISAPVQEIHWKCLVTDVMRFSGQADDSAYYVDPLARPSSDPTAKLKMLLEYDIPEMLSFEKLKEHGIKGSIMGPRKVGPELSRYLAEVENIQSSEAYIEEYIEELPSDELRELAIKYSGKAAKKEVKTSTVYVRKKIIANYVKDRAKGVCQLCGQPAPFIDRKGKPYLESHHIVWLSNDGDDAIENAVALCPNCHKKMHVLNDAEDVAFLKLKAQENK